MERPDLDTVARRAPDEEKAAVRSGALQAAKARWGGSEMGASGVGFSAADRSYTAAYSGGREEWEEVRGLGTGAF
jgi:hypothetical protein